MRVGVDVAPLLQTQAGTARWIRGLLGALQRRDDVEAVPVTWGGAGRPIAVARDVLWYPLVLPWQARRARLDLVHCTIYRGPLRTPVPAVVTVHDLAVLRHPEAFPAWTRLYARTWLRPTLRAARRIAAVSEFSKRETAALVGVPPERIDVVPNAVDPVFRADGPAAEGEYALAVGTVEPRKNLEGAIDAARLAGIELRVVGAAGWGGVRADGSGVRRLGRVGDEQLAELYRGARCLVYPSLYEGFGIPVAEAMACGCPVVTSAASAMAELAGDAAVLADPRDARSIADGIAEAERRRDELVRLGLERARAYTWERAADAAVAAYERALE
ncbi:MAG TPA: glycosyltransferase family 1 protein [Gaiellaceae bacterium]